MKNIKITDQIVKKYFPENSEGINTVLNQRDFPYGNGKRFKNLLKKEVIAYLFQNTNELNDQIDASMNETLQLHYSGVVINSKVDYSKVTVLKTYLGILFQGKPVEGGEISYRKDKEVILFNAAEFSVIAFDSRYFSDVFIIESVKMILGASATPINDEQALAAVYKVNFESENDYLDDPATGFSNAVINGVFKDSFSSDFLPMMYALFVIKNNLQFKSAEFYLGGYEKTYRLIGDLNISLNKEHVEWLKSNDYIDEIFRLKDKGRLLTNLCYLNFPVETLGTSTFLNMKSAYVMHATTYYENDFLGINGKIFLNQNAIQSELDLNFIANQEKKEFPIPLPTLVELKKIYPHSERLNFTWKPKEDASDELVQSIGVFGNIADVFNSNLTILSGSNVEGIDTFLAVPSLFYNTIVKLRLGAEFYHDENYVYAFVGEEPIAACVYKKEGFNSDNISTQKPYSSYGKMGQFDNQRIVYLNWGILPTFVEAVPTPDEFGELGKLPIEQKYSAVYALSAQYGNQLNEKVIVNYLFEPVDESGFKQFKPEFLKMVEKAEAVLAHAYSKDANDILKVELLKMDSIRDQINLIE